MRLTAFDYYHETLYRTRSSQYFLYSIGGASTRWAKYDKNTRIHSNADKYVIMPVSEFQAVDWRIKIGNIIELNNYMYDAYMHYKQITEESRSD